MDAVSGAPFAVATAVKAVLFFTLLLMLVAGLVLFERKVAGFIQDRSGPNRVGPWGLLQTAADGLKFLLKEETDPAEAHRAFFLLAPVLTLVPATLLFAVIPFAAPLPTGAGLVEVVVADLPVGFLYVLAIASLGVYGVVLAGWSSGSKYAFLGGLRGAAQMISYEVGLALSLVPIVLLAGDVRLPEIVSLQQSHEGAMSYGTWFVVPLLLGFFFFFVTGLAEANRLPFDLPEAEAELIAGYHTEYSAMKFGMFFLGEYAHVLTTAALVTTFFLGGWDVPFWEGDNVRVLDDGTVVGDPAWWKTLVTFAAFTVKTALVVTVIVWIRWTLPRFRYDQLMEIGWKFVIEAVTVYVLVIAAAILGLEALGLEPGPVYSLVLLALNVVLAGVLFFVLDRGIVFKGAYRSRRREQLRREGRGDGDGQGGPPVEPTAAAAAAAPDG
ncbi:MAG: NADH-quinone oxidoreductase subunit NuoH [Gemmatimonadota bacterium]